MPSVHAPPAAHATPPALLSSIRVTGIKVVADLVTRVTPSNKARAVEVDPKGPQHEVRVTVINVER